jgi:predicted metal-dependent enzyme (double-stranded beta helix superfamily)
MMTLQNSSGNPSKRLQGSRLLSFNSNKPLLNETQKAIFPLDLKEQRELFRLVNEYCDLAYKSELTSFDLKRMYEIYSLAEYDEILNYWLSQIDQGVDPLFIAIRQKERISLEDFISALGVINSRNMTIEKFKCLVEKLFFNDALLDKYIHFKDSDYCRQLIFQTAHCAIYVISWKPRQLTQPHLHTSSLSLIKVYRGILTHSIFDDIKAPYVHLKGLEGKQLKYEKREEFQYEEDTWININAGDIHQLANMSSENLVTLHFRYFKQPSCAEEDESFIERQSQCQS